MLGAMWISTRNVTRVLGWSALFLSFACGQTRETTPEEQQLARMNRELMNLQQSLQAVQARLDRLESEPAADPTTSIRVVAPSGAAVSPASPASQDEHTLVVKVEADAYLVAGKRLAGDTLQAALQAHVDRRGDALGTQLHVQAAPGIAYSRVVAAIDAARTVGIGRISLSVDSGAEGADSPAANSAAEVLTP